MTRISAPTPLPPLACRALALLGLFAASPALAQENWAGVQPIPEPPFTLPFLPPLSGNEYVEVQCRGITQPPRLFSCPQGNQDRNFQISINEFARASSVAALAGRVGELEALAGRVADLEANVAVQRTFRQGVATAVAIGSAPMPSAPGRTSYDFNLATFRGQEAVGGSIRHRLDTEQPMAVSFGFSSARGRNQAFRLGVSGEF